MTQRIFDIEKDMADLWDIVPDKVYLIARGICDSDIRLWYNTKGGKTSADCYLCDFLKINWHDKTEITRPIQEATEADVGKLCKFWDKSIGILSGFEYDGKFVDDHSWCWSHCRRLTKKEIEELC